MSDVINENAKSEDKKSIEMEEQEQMLNAENKTNDTKPAVTEVEEETKKIDKNEIKDGMEVKPKKIPIGGIQMPGFFTRSRSKEKCKEDAEPDAEGSGLIENDKDQKNETALSQRIKLPNPFRKSKLVNEDEGDKQSEQKDKKKLLPSIRIPLVSVFPRKKDQNLENQTAQAGLASVETLDDKSTDEKDGKEMKNIDLSEKAEQEKEEDKLTRDLIYRVSIGVGLFLLIMLLITLIAVFIPSSPQLREAPVREGKFVEAVTSCGKVEGLVEDSAVTFRGIPYARPPVGDLRFRYAQPLNNIEYCWNGTFLAHNASDYCLQILSNGTMIGVEDCLTLDVVTPYVRYDRPLPVIVLIGADSLMGGSPGKMRPSARYARSRDVVFVRPNFRLGTLGFLALQALSESDPTHTSGNYGLSDILEALHWVQLNIVHFGGDKDSVTLFGHKAGATLVTALAATRGASEYFARAWASSGGALYPQKTRHESELENKKFLEAVKCLNATCLRNLDAEVLVNAAEDTWRKPQLDLPSKTEDPKTRHEWLVLDGHVLREHPAHVWADGNLSAPLVLGTTAHAGSSEKLLKKYVNWTPELVRKHVNDSLLSVRNLTSEALKLYPTNYKGLAAMVTDIRIACPLFAISTQMSFVPFYVVTQPRFEQDLADIDSDIDAILGRYEPKTPEQRRYVSAMQSLFYHFVWHGKIEQMKHHNQRVLEVGQDVLANATYSHCAFWINQNIVLPYAALD